MDKKDWYVPILVIGLSAVFVIVSLAVFLTKGKSSYWLSKKLKIGGLIISLTAITQQACTSSCYDPIPPNNFTVDDVYQYDNDTVNIDFAVTNKLTGVIHQRNGEDFSFNLIDNLQSDTVQRDDIMPLDGKYDNTTEEFEIVLEPSLPSGSYNLNLYETKVSEQTYANAEFVVKVAND
ncbi:MAG: hypothetical protein ABFS32_20460 [Bacteroidota bacterium]